MTDTRNEGIWPHFLEFAILSLVSVPLTRSLPDSRLNLN